MNFRQKPFSFQCVVLLVVSQLTMSGYFNSNHYIYVAIWLCHVITYIDTNNIVILASMVITMYVLSIITVQQTHTTSITLLSQWREIWQLLDYTIISKSQEQ